MEKSPKILVVGTTGTRTMAMRTLMENKELEGTQVMSPEEIQKEPQKMKEIVTGMVLRLERSLDPDPLVILPKENLMDYLRRTPKKRVARQVR
jgi:hypothetical protein